MIYLCSMRLSSDNPSIETETGTAVLTATAPSWQLIVWNDDVNTFDWVIDTLVEVCGHTYEQAEQCSLFIHYKGKYAVKEGRYEDLEPMCNAILDRGISATIEELVA